jgi:MFS family permease
MRKLCLIEVKEETTGWNMAAILLVTAAITISMSFLTLQLVYLLRDPKYFAISDADQVTEITSTITIAALILSMTLSVFLGQLYDIVGRKWLILGLSMLSVLGLVLAPYLSPSIFLLTVDMMLI